MRYSRLNSRRRLALAAALMFPLLAPPVRAQTGNQSDVTGIPITTSSVVSPVFTVTVGGAVRVITFITPQVAQSYQQTAARVNAQLSSQTFADEGGRSSGVAQNLVYEVASGGTTSAQAANRLVSVLTANNASSTTVANAEAFAESFRGLLAKGIAMDPRFFNTLTATQLANAVAAYNAFIDSSSEAFLASPPEELQTIRGVLAQLTGH
jgi:hypothetical protein